MDGCAEKALESATLKTLHAHSFSRSSTQATGVLTDLLSRYIHLLAETCAQYAQHSGRANLTPWDAVAALAELGVDVDELQEYIRDEGRDMAHYARHAPKRTEDLADMRAAIRRGLPHNGDAIPLVYAPAPVPEDVVESDDDDEEPEEDVAMSPSPQVVPLREKPDSPMADARPSGLLTPPSPRTRPLSPPPLPLSPVSNPASPRPAKRPRIERWPAPPHVPDFLPPFPTIFSNDGDISASSMPEPAQVRSQRQQQQQQRQQEQEQPQIKRERSATPPPTSRNTVVSTDYTTLLPYAESTISALPPWHLPEHLPAPLPHSAPRLPTPQVQPSLIGAYHHVLTHPAPPAPPPASAPAARHRVALAFLSLSNQGARWEPAPSLFATTAPNAPAVAAPGPTFAVPDNKEKARDNSRLPPPPPRMVAPVSHIVPLASQQTSRIPELAKLALSGTVHARTTRLAHPPPLKRGDGEELTYGQGVPAQWNVPPPPAPAPGKPPPPKEKEEGERALPDAHFFATWDFESKKPTEPLAPRRANKGTFTLRM